MAEEISDNQFKSDMLDFKAQMMRFVDIAEKKFDGLTSDIRTNSFKMDRLEQGFDQLGRRFDQLEGKFEVLGEQSRMIDIKVDEVASKLMEIDKRLMVVEAKLNLVETKLTTLVDETHQIRLELNDLNETADIGAKERARLGELEIRVYQLEEKLLR